MRTRTPQSYSRLDGERRLEMSETRTRPDEPRYAEDAQSFEIEPVVRKFGAVHILGGLLGFVGPAVWGNDDDFLNVEPGLFLGRVAVNGPHALLHVVFGVLGVRASRDAASARRYMGLNAAFFGALAAVGFQRFGFERGVHMMGGFAMDGWGNLGHAVISAFGLLAVVRSDSES